MLKINKKITNQDKQKCGFSLKREVLIVNEDGNPAALNMSHIFGDNNPYIKVDKMGNTLQLITPFFTSAREIHNFLNNLYDIVVLQVKEEYIWPCSSFQFIYYDEHEKQCNINFLSNPYNKIGITLEALEELINVHKITEVSNQEPPNVYMNIAKQYKEDAFKNRFKLQGFEDLELSTQILIKEAFKEGLEVKVIDRIENFISLRKGQHLEYVKEATKTSKDSYISVLVMENKLVTKAILEENNIKVPMGMEFFNKDEAINNMDSLINKPIVVKPKSTNFGIGISIFPGGAVTEDIIKALDIAFSKDNTVLVEEFIEGKEYRFLVINDKVVGILNRVPANVIGDGRRSIAELVAEKNLSTLRGKGYKTPLEKIDLDDSARLFLKQSNRTIDTIPLNEERVFLRENSNISTGGDSIDYTDEMPERFKAIAVEAAKAVNAKICGVDMIIRDFKEDNTPYGIIELNFNPAIHIHSFPYIGKERKIAKEILKLLGFI